jgi:hypothetical protein
LAVSIKVAHKFDGERFNLRKLNELEVRKQYQIKITNAFAALTDLVSCTPFYKTYDELAWCNKHILVSELFISNRTFLLMTIFDLSHAVILSLLFLRAIL